MKWDMALLALIGLMIVATLASGAGVIWDFFR